MSSFRPGHRFGLRAHPHTGKQLSPVVGFVGGYVVGRQRRWIVTMTRTTKEPKDDATSPTVADVRRRARQSTCHATPGSFELIAGTSLASTSSYPVIRTRRFHHTPSFGPFLLVLFRRPLVLSHSRSLAYSFLLYAGFVISPGMRPVALQAERHRCTWYLSALTRPAQVLHCMGIARGK